MTSFCDGCLSFGTETIGAVLTVIIDVLVMSFFVIIGDIDGIDVDVLLWLPFVLRSFRMSSIENVFDSASKSAPNE